MLIELAANERAVHGDFFNSKNFFVILGDPGAVSRVAGIFVGESLLYTKILLPH